MSRSPHPRVGSSADQVDHIRTQIPLMSSASPHKGSYKSSGEHAVRIRILEQENERFLRKIRGLESQLTELERVHGERIQELLKVSFVSYGVIKLLCIYEDFHDFRSDGKREIEKILAKRNR